MAARMREAGHGRSGSVATRTGLWWVGSAAGVMIVALPDAGDRVFSLSRTHGPSAWDLVGIVVLLLAWAPVAALLWSSRRGLTGGLGRLAAALALVGLAWLVVTVATDVVGLWLVGVALLVLAQMVALGGLWRAERSAAPARLSGH